ncbi:penicillin-binding protein, 1A family [Clostridiales bacterium oral taxon 876 str. F0540]|nr:penicillin-binding protein, 1A family [Clostridiales bacterium oral taxon 876 str. F0540]
MEEDKNTQRKNIKKKRKGLKVFKIIMLTLLSIIVLSAVAGAGVVLAIVKTAPPLDVNQILTLNEPSSIYDSKEQYMDAVATKEKRDVISINDVPKNLSNAFISIEDERFEKHNGIDYQRIAGVIYIDVLNKLKGKSSLQGASTITQQVVRNTMLTNIENEKSFKESATRKIREMYLSLELEKHLSKSQILEAYMNTIPFAGTVYGVEAASNYYFNKPAKDLTLLQCAYIAGLPQSPTRYNAFSESAKKDPSVYLTRTKSVLTMMYKNNYLSKADYDKAVAELNPKNLAFNQASTASKNRLNYEWFALPAIDQIKKDMQSQYHYSETEINNLLMYGGLKIYTTMDRSLQDSVQQIINDSKNIGSDSPQAAAVLMDYHTGEVKAIVGGRGEQPARSFNRAAYNGSSSYPKPVGSSIKPLTVYSAAIDSKQATAATVVEDSPVGSDIKKGWQGWEPKNDDPNRFRGYITLREAMKYSVNLVAIKEEYDIGLKTGASYAEKYGLNLTAVDKSSLAAMALGEINGSTPLTMAAAFGTFGNSGMYTEPRLYTKVVDRRGVTILESKINNRKVLSPQSAYITYDMLKGPVNGGTGSRAKFGAMPAAGKTGTTGSKKEVWFTGLTPYFTASVWIGYDTPTVLPSGISSGTSAYVWGKIMAIANKDLPVKDIERPSGIVAVPVCKVSGKIPTDLCSQDPRGSQVYTELFIDGTQPTTLCDVHVEATINKSNGKIANENTPKDLLEKRIFIKRDYKPSVHLDDEAYVLPTESDDTKPAPPVQTPVQTPVEQGNTNNNNNNNTNNNGSNQNNNGNSGSNGNAGQTPVNTSPDQTTH